MRIRKPALTVIATLGALLGALALATAPALAAEGWGVTSTFGTAGSGNGQFAEPDGVAINQSNGDVYVVDKGNNRVEWFNSAGDYEGQFNGSGTGPDEEGATAPSSSPLYEPSGVAVDNSSGPSKGDVYVFTYLVFNTVRNLGVVDKFEPQADGKYKFVDRFGLFGQVGWGAVAVDPSGHLWVYCSDRVGSENYGIVTEYVLVEGEQKPLRPFETNQYMGPTPAIALDSADNFYLSRESAQLTEQNVFFEQRAQAETERIRPVRSLAVDPSTNDLYVGLENTIAQYSPFGEPFGTLIHGSGIVAGKAEGIAVNSTTGAVYVADSAGNDVAILGLGSVPSAPSTEGVKSITTSTATLTGTVTLNATVSTEYHFDYKIGGVGAECTGESATAAASAGTGSGGQAVSSAITGLQPNQSYSVCLVSTNKFDSAGVVGAAVHFKTLPVPPTVSGVGAPSVTPFAARLEGLVNPNNQATTCEVQYGKTTAYGSELSCGTLEGFNEQGDSVGVTVTGLEPHTTYHFRVVAVNATHEKTESADHEFTTLAAEKPVVEREGSSVQSPSAATLEATVNPNYQETTCEFEYATAAALIGTPGATTVPCPQALGSGGGAVGTSVALSGLTPKTPYYYRVLATNATGTTTDPTTEKFETAPTVAPLISAESATAVTQTTVSLSAQVNPEFQPLTACEIVLSGGVAPVSCNPSAAGLGEGGASVGTGASVTGLAANTEYHYKVHAQNASGLSEGAGQSFLTLPNPPAVSSGGASSVTLTGATISGTVNPGAAGQPAQDETTYYFQYGPTTIYGQGESYAEQTPVGQGGEGVGAKEETASLTGLEPGTTYHYRIVASNDNAGAPQVVYGEDKTFTTVAKSPILGGVSVSGITETSASIATTIDGQGLATSYELWYGTTPGELELSVAGNATAAGSFGAQPLQLNLDTLEPGAVYYYKFVVASPDGTVESPEASFTMVPGPTVPPGLLVITPLLPVPDIAFPHEEAGTITTTTAKALTKAQKLSRALKACRKDKPKGKRAACERHAHKQYGSTKKK
jgi:hypothetical protein